MAAEAGRQEALSELSRLLDVLEGASLCGLGRGLAPVVRSLLRVYADELDPGGVVGGPAAAP
jgi:NADH:ubiquinone oxidoreductase subunit F (NADH-binding)